MILFYSTFTWKHWIGLVITSAAYFIPYSILAKMAKPSYGDEGEILDGGFDMSTGGVCRYESVTLVLLNIAWVLI